MSYLNLLNPIEIKKVEKIKLYFLVKHFMVQLISILLIISTIFVFSSIILQSYATSLDELITKEITIRKDSNVSTIEESTKELNAQLAHVDEIQSLYISWTNFLADFMLLIPKEIILDNMEINTNILVKGSTKTFEISGLAPLRNDLIKLQENLEASINFTDINTPVSNFIQKENINFIITGNITNEIKN